MVVFGASQDKKRCERYGAVVHVALATEEFSLAVIKASCAVERPVFVTRVIHSLEQDGHLERFGPKARPSFRWKRPREAFSASQWIDSKIRGAQIKQGPVGDRPRERLLAHGPACLTTAELLAILIRTGRTGESAVQAGVKIANRFKDRMQMLADAKRGELREISLAVSEGAYCQIVAGVELGRRVLGGLDAKQEKAARLRGPEDAITYCRRRFARLAAEAKQEHLYVVTLDTKHQVIDAHEVSKGILNGSSAHPREVFRPAIRDAAAAVMLVHNHPSGDPTPSGDDLAVTKRLEQAGQQLGIEVLDHIIVTRDGASSVKERGTG